MRAWSAPHFLLSAILPAAALAVTVGNMIGNQTQNEGLDVVPTPGDVTIDGAFDDWDRSGRIVSFADWDARDTFSVESAAMWDEENLYLAFDWRDPFPLDSPYDPRETPALGWRSDAVQLRVKTSVSCVWVTAWGFDRGRIGAVSFTYSDNRQSFANRAPSHTRLFFSPAPGETELGEGVALAHRAADDGRGFAQELRIPWRVLREDDPDAPAYRAKAGDSFTLGLEFHWGGPGDRGGSYHTYIDNMAPGVTRREFFWTATEAWGAATLLPGPVQETRTYTPQPTLPRGEIEVRARVPANREFCTVAIDDADGRRVRNLAGGVRAGDCAAPSGRPGEVVLRWDGLDDLGRPVAPGRYVARSIGSDRIDGFWERSFYNPGNPPWSTADGRGAWGSDHRPVCTVAAAGDAVVCCAGFAEGGYGAFALDADGRKLWSDKRGSFVAAGDAKWTFIVPNDWTKTGTQLLRMETATGVYAPFAKGGDMPVALADIFKLKAGREPPRILGLSLAQEGLLMLCADNALRIVDPATGALLRSLPLHASQFRCNVVAGGLAMTSPGCCPFAVSGGAAYTFFGRDLQRTDLVTGETEPLPARVEAPLAMAADAEGRLYVADDGPDQNVKVFSPDGVLLREIGRRGGRAREGALDRGGMLCPSGVAVDARGRVWVAENQEKPRRISVWDAATGDFVRDFLGNAHYSGHGTFIHLDDPKRAYASCVEIAFGDEPGSWDVAGTMFNAEPSSGLSVQPGGSSFHSGDAFFSSASGERRDVFASLGAAYNTFFFLALRGGDGRWRPCSAIFTVASMQGNLTGGGSNKTARQAPWGEWADCDAADTAIWNDANGDGLVQRSECELVPALRKANPVPGRKSAALRVSTGIFIALNTQVDPEDLGFWARVPADKSGRKWTWGRMVPVAFREGGAPVYSMKGFRPCPNPDFALLESDYALAACPVPGGDMEVGFVKEDGSGWLAAWRKTDCRTLWRYPSPFHGVHGSHNAPMATPGLLVGPLKVMGVAANCGAQGDMSVAMVRGNLGEDYFVTSDGFYVNRFTRDGRLPGIPRPEAPEMLARTSFASLGGWWEPFGGTFSRQSDGVARVTGALPAPQAGNVIRVEGLERIERGEDVTFEVTEADLARAAAEREARGASSARPVEPLVVARGASADAAPAHEIRTGGQPAYAVFRAAADKEALHLAWAVHGDTSPWVNRGKDWRTLFKTGDGVDFQLSPSGNAGGTPVDGDFRLLAAPFGDGAAAVLMRQLSSAAPAGAAYEYSSPVTTVRFAEVRRLAEVPAVERGADGSVTVRLDVPWASLGMSAPAPDAAMRGDAGFILSNADGTLDAARVYRSNRNTGLVSDMPGEARLEPRGWSEVKFSE